MKCLYPLYENELIASKKYSYIVGIDEVGRGCVAGPVAVGGFLYQSGDPHYEGVNDSKFLTSLRRSELHKQLSKHKYFVKYGDASTIDQMGIGKLLQYLIDQIIIEFKTLLNSEDIFFLIDGQFSRSFGTNSAKVIKGDSTYYSIAAASILAKVERDLLMSNLSELYPNYNLAKHKGYATKEHREAIKKWGACDIHRRTFLSSILVD